MDNYIKIDDKFFKLSEDHTYRFDTGIEDVYFHHPEFGLVFKSISIEEYIPIPESEVPEEFIYKEPEPKKTSLFEKIKNFLFY